MIYKIYILLHNLIFCNDFGLALACVVNVKVFCREIEPEYESLRPKLAANIEKARIAMSRLEEIFTQNPALQNTDVMRKLLEVYKDCR